MSRMLAVFCLVGCFTMVTDDVVLAQGKGSQPGRSTAQATAGAALSGRTVSRSKSTVSRTSRPTGSANRVSRSTYRLPQAHGSMKRTLPARAASMVRTSGSTAHRNSRDNWDRMQQHRREQSEQSRTLAGRGANEALSAAAASRDASVNHKSDEVQTMRLNAPNEEVVESDVVAPIADPAATAVPEVKKHTAAKQSFRFRSR